MKKVLSTLVLVTLFVFPFPLLADEGEPGREVEIHETTESVGIPRIPDYGQEISCFIVDDELWLYTSYPELLWVEVRNYSTGYVGTHQIMCSEDGIAIPVLREGLYELYIQSLTGRTYRGYFSI